MPKALQITPDEAMLAEEIAGYAHDPFGFVMFAFPWGEGELEGFDGPEAWAREVLEHIGNQLQAGVNLIRIAVVSGNGIGKTALIDMLCEWAISTCEDCLGIVTAGTENQLRTKTWAQLAKWHRLSVCGHWFEYTATALYSRDPSHERTWRIDAIPWNKTRPDAFSGLHNKKKRIIILCDEGSTIDDVIHEMLQGALTDSDTEIIWVVFGNGVRNTGWFRECFRKFRHRWAGWHIDSRAVKISNKELLQQWIDDYGIDSDYVKTHVLGEFPAASDLQFISEAIVTPARGRHLREDQYNFAATIITCDPAWTGGDEVVIWLRQGLMSKKLGVYPKNDDDGEIAGFLMHFEDEYRADAVFIDFGYGTGIYSFGKQNGRDWMLVDFGGASADPGYLNKRAEMWGLMRNWLRTGGSIPDDPRLAEELTSVEYCIVPSGPRAGAIKLESKQDMKKRGLPSPNRADALAISFAFPVMPKSYDGPGKRPAFANHDYDPLAR